MISKALLEKILLKVAIVASIITFVMFIVICTFNTWSPGCSFGCGYDDPMNHTESQLMASWFFLGLIPTIAFWLVLTLLTSLDEWSEE